MQSEMVRLQGTRVTPEDLAEIKDKCTRTLALLTGEKTYDSQVWAHQTMKLVAEIERLQVALNLCAIKPCLDRVLHPNESGRSACSCGSCCARAALSAFDAARKETR